MTCLKLKCGCKAKNSLLFNDIFFVNNKRIRYKHKKAFDLEYSKV